MLVLQTQMKPQIMLLAEERCAITFLSDHQIYDFRLEHVKIGVKVPKTVIEGKNPSHYLDTRTSETLGQAF